MSRILWPILLLSLIFAGCAADPRRELQAARMAVAQAQYAGAPEWAPDTYEQAVQALQQGEEFLRSGSFEQAREVLPQAETLALQALEDTRQEQDELERQRQAGAEAEKREKQRERRKALAKKHGKTMAAPPPPPPKPKPAPEPPPPVSYQVGQSETLWMIAARREVYGDPLLWPLLYQANRDQIKDPRQIYPGQILNVPRDLSAQAQEEAREKARKSEVIPPDLFLKGNVTAAE